MIGSILFHIGILLLFVGHFVGLLTPLWVYEGLGVSVPSKQMLAITAGPIQVDYAQSIGRLLNIRPGTDGPAS